MNGRSARGILGLLLVCGCSALRATPWPKLSAPPPQQQAAPAPASTSTPTSSANAAPRCEPTPRAIGRVRDERLDEISGVAESHRDPRVLFVHNDSGDIPRFFAIDRTGKLLAELTLATVPLLLDAEDIAIGPGPGGGSFIYLGDTGNNFATGLGIPRRKAVVYRIPELAIPASENPVTLSLPEAFPIVLTFPERARNVEAFFVDPPSGDLIAIAKQPDGVSEILAAPAAMLAAGGGELQRLGELRFGHPPLSGNPMTTSASIERDGSAILVRTYSSVFLFRRSPQDSVMQALSRPPRLLPSPPERQGEAITFSDGDSAFLTISEGGQPAIYCASLPTPSGFP